MVVYSFFPPQVKGNVSVNGVVYKFPPLCVGQREINLCRYDVVACDVTRCFFLTHWPGGELNVVVSRSLANPHLRKKIKCLS